MTPVALDVLLDVPALPDPVVVTDHDADDLLGPASGILNALVFSVALWMLLLVPVAVYLLW